MARFLIALAGAAGWIAIVWYGAPFEVYAYTAGILIALGVWGSIARGREPEPSPKERMLADIDLRCEVRGCGRVSETSCLGVHLCYRHWRILRPTGVKCLWGFTQKSDEKL